VLIVALVIAAVTPPNIATIAEELKVEAAVSG
jgi:hypothetical protein